MTCARSERLARRDPLCVLGRKAVLGLLGAEPTDIPKTVVPRRELRPSVACKEKARRIAELAALVEFRARRYVALLRHLAGEPGVRFPDGTYRVRGFIRTASRPLAPAP